MILLLLLLLVYFSFVNQFFVVVFVGHSFWLEDGWPMTKEINKRLSSWRLKTRTALHARQWSTIKSLFTPLIVVEQVFIV
jgi:hypothetical protein